MSIAKILENQSNSESKQSDRKDESMFKVEHDIPEFWGQCTLVTLEAVEKFEKSLFDARITSRRT